MTARRGSVWFGTTRVGDLVEGANGQILFQYDSTWLGSGFGISLSVPPSGGELDAHEFFAGLLPEGLARQRICRQYRLREDDDLGLLLAIGRDCAGALAVLPGDASPVDEAPVPITHDDLVRLIDSHGQLLPASAERPRFSLAGAQHKVAVRVEGDEMWLPTWSAPSSHILKFETARWVCFAEFAANDLARRLGLPVPDVTFHTREGEPGTPYLKIARYDRVREGSGVLRRVHQEDMTQALGISSLLKYEEYGGPGLGVIATLLRRHSDDPIADILALCDWQIFNYLAGNSDGHAKNLSLVYGPDELVPRLAPLYDLVCVEFMNRLGMRYERKLAFFIGNNNLPEQITRDDWAAHASALGVPAKSLLERVREMSTALPSLAALTHASFADQFGDNRALDRFDESIRDRCDWTLRSVFGRG